MCIRGTREDFPSCHPEITIAPAVPVASLLSPQGGQHTPSCSPVCLQTLIHKPPASSSHASPPRSHARFHGTHSYFCHYHTPTHVSMQISALSASAAVFAAGGNKRRGVGGGGGPWLPPDLRGWSPCGHPRKIQVRRWDVGGSCPPLQG